MERLQQSAGGGEWGSEEGRVRRGSGEAREGRVRRGSGEAREGRVS